MKELEKAFYLQLFAEDSEGGGDDVDNAESPENSDNTNGDSGSKSGGNEKKYSDKDVDTIISKKFADWEKRQQKAIKDAQEAERLKTMTEQEKRDHELKQLKEKIAGYEHKETLSGMAKVARSILADQEITISDELLSNLVTDNADDTKNNVQSFAKLFKTAVQKEVAAKLRHDEPKKGGKSQITREQILKIKDPIERKRLIAKNLNLFK